MKPKVRIFIGYGIYLVVATAVVAGFTVAIEKTATVIRG